MTQIHFRDLLKASIPIFVGIFIVLIYVLFIKEFIYCDWEECDPKEQSLVSALPIENVGNLVSGSGDTPEMAREKTRKLYEHDSLRLSGRILWTSLEATYFISSLVSYFVAF